MTPEISLIIMAYNEEKSLAAVFNELRAALKELKRPFEIVIINDGSTDSTGRTADSLADNENVRVIHHKGNQGLGAVYRTGFKEAKGDFITFFPADGQFSAGILKKYAEYTKTHDVILGFIPDRKSSVIAKCLSAFERVLLWMLFGPIPRFQGIIMFRRGLLETVKLKSSGRGWTILMELIIRLKKSGQKMITLPIGLRPRAYGHSKVNNIPCIIDNIRQIFILRLNM